MARNQAVGVGNFQHELTKKVPSIASIQKERNSFGFWLFFVGLNVYFFLPFIFPTDSYSSAVGSWRYYFASYLCLLVGSMLEIKRLHLEVQPILKTWAGFFLGILGWMIVRSLIVGESSLTVLWNAMIYLSLVSMAVLGQSGRTWKTLDSLFVAHTFIGSTFTLYTLFMSGVTQRIDLMTMVGYNIVSGSGTNVPAALYAVPFLVLSFPGQPKLGKMAALLGYGATVMFFVFWQSRIGSILLVVQLAILMLIWWRGVRLRLFRLGGMVRGVLMLGVIFVIWVSLLGMGGGLADRLAAATSLLSDRWSVGGSILGTVQEDYRLYEAKIFVQQLSWDEWIGGRGVAGTWQDIRAYGGQVRTMVHIGYLHYILNGGVLLLILMLVPAAFGVRALVKGKDLRTIASGGLWVQYSALLLGYGFPSASLTWVLMGLAFGKCVMMSESPPQLPLAKVPGIALLK